MRSKRVILLLAAALALLVVVPVGATGKGEAQAPTKAETFSLYVGDFWQTNYIDPSWTDPVAKEITRRTGVTLQVSVVKSEDDDGEMNKLIAAGDLTDLIFRGGGSSKQALAKGGLVKPLDDLIEKYGPNIKKYHAGTFNAWRNRSDGKIYSLGFWYFNQVSKFGLNLQVSTLQMR
ncbi:MAG TPA: extracellular solute-binding protein, partial [Spirochaetia bacterium]|nr:extracellular solute-binding protein [Spirochaetia bacterium]